MDFSYINQSLMSGENVVYRTHPHWIIFSPAIAWFIVMLLSLFVLPFTWIGQITLAGYKPFYLIFSFLGLAGAVFSGVMAYVQYISSEYGITNKRVIVKIGLVQRTTMEVLLSRIESIQVVQSIPGRLLDYGTIIICGTGGSRDAFRNMPSPMRFHLMTQEQTELQRTNSQ